jgi:hypothetical protein
MIPYIIKDMITAGLLKLINHKVGYQLLKNPKEKEIKKLVYLESWN